MLKTNKKQSVFFFFLKLILFVAVGYLIYSQLNGIEEEKWKDFSIKRPFSLVAAVVLVIPNMWMAFMKWKVTLRLLEIDEDKKRNVHSFFAGLVTGMLTPNMVGNFIGRLYYFETKHRGTITFLTLVSNYAQLLATLFFGLIAVFLAGEIYQFGDSWQLMSVFFLGCSVAFLCYFFIELALKLFKRSRFLSISRSILKENPSYRWKMISWSIARFVVFTLQFSLVLHAFGETWTWDLIIAIWQVYLITMMFPSLFLGKLGVKEMISIEVLGALELNEISILFASLIIWFVNSLGPALVGLIICDRPKK
ncbi:MAG: lysylphosphatidylglycerol synthase domain-containing protein [Crocinitomicaceae bacterium]|nr:lysylphosphatidylglycerol synthase domain-containing protein [Crocinitomicaceae bacterium]